TPRSAVPPLFPYTTLFRSGGPIDVTGGPGDEERIFGIMRVVRVPACNLAALGGGGFDTGGQGSSGPGGWPRGRGRDSGDAASHRSEEHTSELQSRFELVCR